MYYFTKKDLFSYFDNKENRTEEEEKLYKALKDELKFFDTTSICRDDVREIMNDENMELSENDMIDLADALDNYYIENGYTEDVKNHFSQR